MRVVLPRLFKPRDYQSDVMKAFFIEKKKRFVCVFHRRAGKDRVWFNILIAAAMQRKGLYLYSFPTQALARKAIWEGISKDGVKFLDQIPTELMKGRVNNSEMRIELVNGSVIRFVGTDMYDRLRGINALGVVFSEYAEQNPTAWESVIRPILSENNGWASFIYTPKGMNHGYDIYNNNLNNDEWYISKLTVEDTRDADGNPIISKKVIEAERKSGMSDDAIQQEYYCSFEAANVGAIFSLQFQRAYDEDRIRDFPVDSAAPVFTFWDLGLDAVSIWLIQRDGEYWKAIDFYENKNQHINFYFDVLAAIKKRHNIIYVRHYLPHDAINKAVASEYSVLSYFNKFLLPCDIVPRIDQKERAIEQGRVAFDRCIFHKSNCFQGLHSLRSYRKKFDDKLKIFSKDPLHDWASHGADAFLQFGQALHLGMLTQDDSRHGGVLRSRVFTGSL